MMEQAKRFKREPSSLEFLPNELFVAIFSYLNGVDTVYAFAKLNTRFQCLLHDYVEDFDFKSTSKAKFDFILRVHDTQQWRSLCLSNGERTPGQIKSFSQLFPPRQNINHIKSLIALDMTPEYASEFFLQINSLQYLTSLSVDRVCGLTINAVELPALKRLCFTSCKRTEWIMNFLNLEHLQYTIKYSCSHTHHLIVPQTLTKLKLFYDEGRDGDAIRTLLHQMPQLTTLALFNNATYSPLPNGQTWEKLIVASLPLLQTFQFYFPFESYRHTMDDFNQTIQSFSTPFYLLQKRWFIRCDRNRTNLTMGALYTLPYAFSQMPINTSSFDDSLSTLPLVDVNEIKSNYYTKVKTLIFNQKCKEPHVGFLSSNIHRLILSVNIPSSWLCLLTNLHHLSVGDYMEMTSIDFGNIVDHAPNLQSLTISCDKLKKLTDKFQNAIICQQLSQRIHSLTISHRLMDFPSLGVVSVRALSSLVRIFSSNCQHLAFALIAHPNTVRPILRRMKDLRSLHVQWRHLHFDTHDSDSVASWLQQQSTDPNAIDYVQTMDNRHLFIWFGNRF